jgi:protein-S-isoprenylcysteine O-methyltransferase Ste14
MFPILLMMYGRLAITEETEMRAQFGEEFDRYALKTPRFFPRWR